MSRLQRFPARPDSVRKARSFAAGVLADVDDRTRDEIILMVSELGTNSLRHGRSEFSVDIDLRADEVRIVVADDGPGVPSVKAPEHDQPSGRGLMIIDRLADAWGIGDPADGTSVWFVMKLDELLVGAEGAEPPTSA